MTEPIDKETETQQETKRETEQETQKEGENLVSTNSLEPKSVSVSCPVCGKPFTRETQKKAFNAVRGHFMGTKDEDHKGKFPYTMADLGLVKTNETDEEPISEQIETQTPLRRKAKRKTQKAEPTWETEGTVPDSLTLLKNQLCLYGLNSRNAIAVVDYMRSYHVDDVLVLNKALMDVGMSTSKRRMFLESWVNARNINIGYEVQEELRLFQRDEYVSAYDKMGMRIRPREREEEKESNRQFSLGHQIGELNQRVRQLTEGSDEGGYEDPRIGVLTGEIKKLSSQLADEKEKRNEQRFTHLEELIKKSAENRASDLQTVSDTIRDVSKNYFAFLSGVTDEAPKRERIKGETNVLSFIPTEMTE